MITQKRLRQLLFYNPATGTFVWRVQRGGRAQIGSLAGSKDRDGRRQIKIDQKIYCANKLAWLYVKGVYPKLDVDHADQDKSNDRWGNLRLATRSQNLANRPATRTNKLGVKGVTKLRNRYVATIGKNKKHYHLGVFDTVEEAAACYQKALVKMFGQFASW